MLIERIGRDSVVILLDRRDDDREEYLLRCAKSALYREGELNLKKPELRAYHKGGKKLVFVTVPVEDSALFRFETLEDLINGVREVYRDGEACRTELYGDGSSVYIKTSDKRGLTGLREYGEATAVDGRELVRLGGPEELKRLCR